MSKISLIIQREYTTRVRKKSFLIMSILGPILFAALFIIPVLIAQMEETEERIIAVIDDSKEFEAAIPNTETLKFSFLNDQTLKDVKEGFKNGNFYAVLYIPPLKISLNTPEPNVQLFSDKQPNMDLQMHITHSIEKEIIAIRREITLHDENERIIKELSINDPEKKLSENLKNLEQNLQKIKAQVKVQTIKWTETGEEETDMTLSIIVGIVSGILIYMFVFIYGAQVMRGVIEEKTSRIIEVIVSSVRPFQLMMGKVIGVALVGLTQFLIWVVLSFLFITVAQTVFTADHSVSQLSNTTENVMSATPETATQARQDINMDEMKEKIFASFYSIPWGTILFAFLFFFLFGYLLYASLFAAVGAAVDNDTDTQQFMLPISAPLIISIVLLQNIVMNPEGQVAFWFSMIPFTSPVVMMARIPFGVLWWEIVVSIGILILTFIGSTWVAGKIYRIGILMYGKKISYRELLKWIRYKN